MSQRKIRLTNGNYYHVYNRGINKIPIHHDVFDYRRARRTIDYYRFINARLRLSEFVKLPISTRDKFFRQNEEKHIEIIAYCLMPNHFHFILQQLTDKGISNFVSQFSNSYTRYFNTKYQRTGHLFQSTFKAVFVEDDEQLIHLSRYIHLNPIASALVNEDELKHYQWSSFRQYLDIETGFATSSPIIDQFNEKKSYEQFVFDHVEYARKLEELKHLILE